MARKLELDVTGDSKDAGRALDAAARNVDELRRSADRLQHEFKQAERAASGLDRQLLQTKLATAALAREFARTGDMGVSAQLDQQKAKLRELSRLRRDVIGDTEHDATRAAAALKKAAKDFDVLKDRNRDKGFFGLFAQAPKLAAKAGADSASTFSSALQGGLISGFKALPAEAQAALIGSLGGAAVLAAPVIASAINAAVITGVGLGGLAAGIALAARDEGVKRAFAEMGREALKGLSESASPFVDELHRVAQVFGDGFKEILPDLKGIFGDLATTVEPLARGLVGLAKEALPGIRKAAAAAVPMLEMLARELPDLGRAMGSFFDSIAEGGPGAIVFMQAFLDQVEAGIVGLGVWLREYGKVLAGAAVLADAMGLTDFDPSIVTGKIGPIDDSVTDLGNSFREAKREITSWKDELDKAFGVTMDQATATLNLKQALDDFKDSLKQNRGEWDLNTEAGRRHIQALQDAIQAAYDKMQSDIAAGKSASAAREEFNKTKDSLLEQARAAGATDAAIGILKGTWESFLKTPSTKDLTVRVHQVGSVSSQGVIGAGDQRRSVGSAYASGGRYEAGMPRIVGEQGWEIDVPDHGGYILNHADAKRAMSRGGSITAGWNGPSGPSVNVHVYGSVVTERQLVELIESTVSRLGGSPALLGIKA